MACEPNRVRLLCMLLLTAGFFVVEVVVSRITASLAMLSDSFHMLSDVIALLVALVAVRFAGKTQSTNKNTFGWVRAEVMGALVNAVFLTALCFTIVLEAIERFTEPNEIERPYVVIGVGAGGLLVNLLGLCLFHGHAGGGHGHSHGGGGGGGGGHGGEGHGHSHGKKNKSKNCKSEKPNGSSSETNTLVVVDHNSPNGVNAEGRGYGFSPDGTELQTNGSSHYQELDDSSAAQLNMRGVFLHVLGDALGSVIVVVNALIFTFVWQPCPDTDEICFNPCVDSHSTDHRHVNNSLVNLGDAGVYLTAGPCWVLYLDPSLCIIMVCILLYTTYPLLKESALILLQTVPKQIDMHLLSEKLLDLDGVLAIHELHIWQLAGSRIIATAHIKCHDPTAYMDVAKRIKDFFHDEGIHATTIQPEFVTVSSDSRDSLCELSCRTQCAPKLCCGAADKPADKKAAEEAEAPREASPATLEVISEDPEQAAALPLVVQPEAAAATREVESSL
ncbi:hypothetical protein CRUP_022763 [Coryphaenoides rupestris]|nr:hypothetical protein CRUP_022763 [Coryphaenoides rupestris]